MGKTKQYVIVNISSSFISPQIDLQFTRFYYYWALFPDDSAGRDSTCSAGRWLVRFLGLGNPLESMATHSSFLAWRIPMDRGAQWAVVQRVAKSDTTVQPNTTMERQCCFLSWAEKLHQSPSPCPELWSYSFFCQFCAKWVYVLKFFNSSTVFNLKDQSKCPSRIYHKTQSIGYLNKVGLWPYYCLHTTFSFYSPWN